MKLKILVDYRIERGINPPMPAVITMPLVVDGDRETYQIYLTVNPFKRPAPSPKQLVALAEELTKRIEGYK